MKRRGVSQGYTVVELMMALTVLAIGISGVIAMQKVTVASNQHAKNLALATHIAQSWAEELAVDSLRWNTPTATTAVTDIAQTTWLDPATNGLNVWFRPAFVNTGGLSFGPAFDALGNIVPDTQAQQAVFCTHLRLNWLYPQTSGNGVLRVDIRVFWPREGQGTVGGTVCAAATAPAAIGAATTNYHFVHQTTAIKEHTQFP